ncbi:MAG: PaaI family thioesterase [Acidimicrobiales bacterium]|nr:PaaI family thioesterase [Acidimicrobiales bacterium]
MPVAVTVDQVNAFIEANLPFTTQFGIRCDALDEGGSLMRWSHDLRWTRPGGEQAFVCGPVMMALADVGIYVAVFTLAGITPLALTNELRTNFLRPAFGGDLLCRSRIVKAGRRIAYGTSDVFVEGAEHKLVAQSSSTYVMPDAG